MTVLRLGVSSDSPASARMLPVDLRTVCLVDVLEVTLLEDEVVLADGTGIPEDRVSTSMSRNA